MHIQFLLTYCGQNGHIMTMRTHCENEIVGWKNGMIYVFEMAIKFPCRKHLVNYIGCHITGTIYSGAQIRWITFALELKNIWCILILLKHSQNQPSWCKNLWKYIWSIFTIHSGFGCEWQPSQISCFQKCKKFHVEIPNSCKTIQYVQFGTSASMFGFDNL